MSLTLRAPLLSLQLFAALRKIGKDSAELKALSQMPTFWVLGYESSEVSSLGCGSEQPVRNATALCR